MSYRRLSFVIIVFISLAIGCKKHSTGAACEKLKQGMITDNKEEVKMVITQFIDQLSSKNYTPQNLNELVVALSQCTVSATVLCFDCIKTLPSQSEIRLSFTSSGSVVAKTIDISYSPDNKMKVVSMHE